MENKYSDPRNGANPFSEGTLERSHYGKDDTTYHSQLRSPTADPIFNEAYTIKCLLRPICLYFVTITTPNTLLDSYLPSPRNPHATALHIALSLSTRDDKRAGEQDPGPCSCSLLLLLFQSTPSSSSDKSFSLLSALTSVRSITQPTLHRLPRLHSSSSS